MAGEDSYLQIYRLIPKFKERWVHGYNVRWSRQFMDKAGEQLSYFPMTGLPEDRHFNDHFTMTKKPLSTSKGYYGSLAMCGKFDGDLAMWWCVDGDNSKAVEAIWDKLIPLLERKGIEYIYEYSGKNEERCHLWIMLNKVPIKLLREWAEQLLEEAGIDFRDKVLNLELYPSHKENNVIRIPGFHLKTWKFSRVRRHDGEEGNTPLFVLESFLRVKQLTESELRAQLKPKTRSLKVKKQIVRRGPFFYNPRNLPVKWDNLPKVLAKMAHNCQAIARLINEAVDENLIEDRGGMNHLAGLYLYNLAFYNDAVSRTDFKACSDGKKWAEEFFKSNRFRSYKEHNWDQKTSHTEANKLVPRCETLERDFGYCTGCPFKNLDGFDSPRLLYWGKPITKRPVREVRLQSHNQIRTSTFNTFKQRVRSLVEAGARKRLLLASPQGSGKSLALDDIAVSLARDGFKVLMAVHSGDIALEHQRRIEERGSHAYLNMSHRNHFEKYNPGFDCPAFEPIQDLIELGVSSNAIKKNFCDRCPLLEQCRYPRQYIQALEPEHNIVIIQHAHFASDNAMQQLLKKRFDVLMIDEAFIDKCLVQIKASEAEWTALRAFEYAWTGYLADWLQHGGMPHGGTLYPKLDELRAVKDYFDDHTVPWRIPQFLRAFNGEYFLDVGIGLHIYCPPPIADIPLTVMTDATPPLEMLQIYLDDPDIEVYGDDEVIDFRTLNPDNKVIQALDGTVSKTYLRGTADGDDWNFEGLIEYLEFIGDKARNEYKDKRILITTYKDFKRVCLEWLQDNYPDIMDRVLVSHMKVGTNEFDQYEVQFLLAGVYLNAKQFHKQVFELKTVANYWNRLRDRAQIPNYFWWGVGDNADIERRPEPVRRIQCEGNVAAVYEYDDFKYSRPEDYYYNLVEKFAIAKSQQAIRLRFNDATLKIVYVFSRFFLPSFLITDTVLCDELLGYLRNS